MIHSAVLEKPFNQSRETLKSSMPRFTLILINYAAIAGAKACATLRSAPTCLLVAATREKVQSDAFTRPSA